ncbi:MAG: Calx-beta domain-containing protein, partial [Pseudomonadota bacterium]
GGIGAGTVSGGGDTQVCFVEPDPDSGKPRLDLSYIDLDTQPTPPDGVTRAHQGDQVRWYYLVTNNDQANSVQVEVGVTTNQVARLPSGDNNDNTLFAFSDPTPGTDNFPVQFGDVLGGDFLPLPDPHEVSDRLITREFQLPPSGIAVVPIEIRSHGMCADGSCNEMKIYANGQYENNTAERACHGAAIIVDNSQPLKTPQCRLDDIIQTGPNVDSQWSAGFFGSEFLTTFASGHLNLNSTQPFQPLMGQNNQPIVQTTSESLAQQFNMPFPPMLHNSITTDNFGGTMEFSMTGFPQNLNFQQKNMQVTVTNIPPNNPVVVPLIGKQTGQSNLRVDVDPVNQALLVVDLDNNQTLFDGPAVDLQNNPVNDLFVDPETFRMVMKEDKSDQNTMVTEPLGISQLYVSPQDPTTFTINVLNAQTKQPISWEATVSKGAGTVSLTTGSGPAGTPITLMVDTSNVALSPDTTLAAITVTNNAMLNSPLEIPIALRRTSDYSAPIEPPTPSSTLQFTSDFYQLDEMGNAGTTMVQVVRMGSSEGAASVNYRLVDIEAIGDIDFTRPQGTPTLDWADGDSAPKSIMVEITNDNTIEADESFSIQLFNPTGSAALGTPDSTIVEIIDDDEVNMSVGIGPNGAPVQKNTRFGGSIESGSGGRGASLSVVQTDPVTVRGRFLIDPDDVGKTADIIILALYTPPFGEPLPFMRDGLFWTLWDERIESLAAADTRALDSFFDITVIDNFALDGLPGQFLFFFAYSSDEVGLIFPPTPPLSLTVE